MILTGGALHFSFTKRTNAAENCVFVGLYTDGRSRVNFVKIRRLISLRLNMLRTVERHYPSS